MRVEPRTKPAPPSFPVALIVWGLFWLATLGIPLSAAAYTFTPGVTVRLGYDDNVRLTRSPRGDFFTKVSPGFRFQGGEPARLFELSAQIDYAHYYRLSEETRWEGGTLNLRYHYEPSQNWRWEFSNNLRSTHDAAEIDEQGDLIRVRERTGRLDRNATRVAFEHDFGQGRSIGGGYTLAINRRNDDELENSIVHQGQLVGAYRFNPDWRAELETNYYVDDYEKSVDQHRLQVLGTLAYMMGPSREALMILGYQQLRAISDDPELVKARDYDIYSASLGYSHSVSPTLDWQLNLGWSWVSGDSRSNQAAGSTFPTCSLQIDWQGGPRWRFTVNASTDLGEYDLLGENTGLTFSQRIGSVFSYDLAQRWSLSLRAEFVRNNYKQDPLLAQTERRGDVDSLLLGAVLDWRVTRDVSLALDYRYLDRNSEDDADDRSQNQIMLVLKAERPTRW